MPEFDVVINRDDYLKHSKQTHEMLKDIERIIIESNDALEGNSFYVHGSINLYPDLYTKQLNLFWCGKQATTKICEIGFNAGHSSMLMLLGRDNTPLNFTVFDIGHHAYTKPCLAYLKERFKHVSFEYIEGDSIVSVPNWMEANKSLGEYDVVHVDGGHSESCISNDMKHANLLVRKGGIVIVDDTNVDYINETVNMYISNGMYREMDVLQTKGYPHRIIQKILSSN